MNDTDKTTEKTYNLPEDFSLSMFWPDLTFILRKLYQLIRSLFDKDYEFVWKE